MVTIYPGDKGRWLTDDRGDLRSCRHSGVSYVYRTDQSTRTTSVTATCQGCGRASSVAVSDLTVADKRFDALQEAGRQAREALERDVSEPIRFQQTEVSERVVNVDGRFGVALRRVGSNVELHLLAAAGVSRDVAVVGWSRAWHLAIYGSGTRGHFELRGGQEFRRELKTEDEAEVVRLRTMVDLLCEGWERATSAEKLETFIERRLRERNESRPQAVTSTSAGVHSLKLRRMFGQGG